MIKNYYQQRIIQNRFERARERKRERDSDVSMRHIRQIHSHSSFYEFALTVLLRWKCAPFHYPVLQDSISTHASGRAAPQLLRKFTASANVYLRFLRSHKRLARGIRRWTRLIEHERNIRKTRDFPFVGIYCWTHPRLRRQRNSFNEFHEGYLLT